MAKLKLYLDARHVSSKTGEAPVKVAVSHKTKTAYIPLNVSIKPTQWDEKSGSVVKHQRRKTLNDELDNKLSEMKLALKELDEKVDLSCMTANEVRDELLEILNPDKVKPNEDTLAAVFTQFISHKTGRTKNLYECTERKLSTFVGNGYKRVRFEQVNVDWLYRFNEYLAKTSPSANARAIHMRNLRAVFNFAIDNEITNNYPFRRFKIKNEPTRKRNFNVMTLRAIFNAKNLEPWQEKYRDLFKLMFMLMGINFVDLCNLQDIKNGRIEYIRAKTKKLYSIKVEPEMEEIIAKYRGDNNLLNYLDTYKSYRHFYNNVCKGLHAIKDRLNETTDADIDELTTYWARHSWATIAASLDIPKETIAAGLGHSGHTVTDIYIEFDKSKVDVANRRVLNWVLYGWEDGYDPNEKRTV